MASWKNKESVLHTLRRLPPALKAAQAEVLEQETAAIVAAMKRACPVGGEAGESEEAAGKLRDSIHSYDGHRAVRGGVRAELMKTIIADARDGRGEYYGPHVEYGHVARGGKHVPAHPFFWPTWRAMRAGLRRKLAARGREVCKQIAGDMAR